MIQVVGKLNSDNCSKGNPGKSEGGGLFRDSEGKFLLAFSCYFVEMTNLQEEL